MSLPNKLEKVTLVEVVAEFRYKNSKNIEDLFFDIFSKLKPDGYEHSKLPIMELPPVVRDNDPNFTYQAYYTIQKGKYHVNIGPRVLSFNIKGYYPGWSEYKGFILSNIEKFSSVLDTWELERTSMRYIDFFEKVDIFDQLNIVLTFPDGLCESDQQNGAKVLLNEIYCNENVMVRMQIANNSEVAQEGDAENRVGSIFDLDAYSIDLKSSVDSTLEELHDKNKVMFFRLLKDEFLRTLGPTYEEE